MSETTQTPTRLPEGATSGRSSVRDERIYVLHGEAPVYFPAPGGGTYCNTATCTHWHQDTPTGKRAAEECSEKLRRSIERGIVPTWATLAYPLPS